MSKIFITATFLLFHNYLTAQDSLFTFRIIQVQDTVKSKSVDRNRRKQKPIYEDDRYLIYATCSGEWGGSLWFTNKATNARFECEATCPVVIYRIGLKYIIISSLAHLRGFSEILEIENPDLLKPVAKRIRKDKDKIILVGSNESSSKIGTRTLLDSVGVMILGAFPYNNELYYIVTDHERTFLAKMQNRRFQLVKLLVNEHMTGYNPEVVKYNNSFYRFNFDYDGTPGYFEIKGRNIVYYKFK